jgi:hypothetical protein
LIARASEVAYRQLATAPETKGDLVAEALFRCRIPPLVIYYCVEADKRPVKVVGVRHA